MDERVTGSTLAVALLLATHGNRRGQDIRITDATLAAEYGSSDKTVSRAREQLSRLGWLEVIARGHNKWGDRPAAPSRYRLAVPDVDGLAAETTRGEVHRRARTMFVELTATGHLDAHSRPATGQIEPRNRTNDPPQPDTHVHLSGKNRVEQGVGGDVDLDMPRCAQHRGDPTPPPCGRCKDARVLAVRRRAEREAAELEQQASLDEHRRGRQRDCERCDAGGWVLDVEPAERCTHEESS